MTIYTYRFSRSLAESLGIPFTEIPELSDQMIDLHQPDDYFANYATRGGGAAGSKNGHYGCKHTEETKQVLREKRLGKSPSNKGIPNPECSERMKKNNPMKNPEIAAKVIETRRKNNSWYKGNQFQLGHKPHNYIDEMRTFCCDACGKENTVRNVKGGKTRRFCNRSCQATFTNTNRRGFKSTKSHNLQPCN